MIEWLPSTNGALGPSQLWWGRHIPAANGVLTSSKTSSLQYISLQYNGRNESAAFSSHQRSEGIGVTHWQHRKHQNTNVSCCRRRRSLERLEGRCLLAGDVVISEFMAANASTLVDEDGDTSDWIELHNPNLTPVDLTGWTVSDNAGELDKWMLPGVELDPGGFLVVFASGKNRRLGDSELHTNFKLSKDGEYLGLGRPDGTVEDEYRDQYPAQRADISYGQNSVDGELTRGFMTDPTPGQQNSETRIGFAGDVQVDTAGGFFHDPILVAITSLDPEATIRYTVDGSLPTADNGHEYTGSLEISSTTTLRAAAVRPNYITSAAETRTYLFLDDIVRQKRPDSYPELASGDNYEVDPQIALSPQYHDRFLAGLQDIQRCLW